MRAMLLVVACSLNLPAAGREMNVVVCNLGDVSESVVSRAKSETTGIYRSAGVQLVWHVCDTFPSPASQETVPWFVIRLRNDKPPRTVGPASLDAMGRAFVEDRGGTIADAYFPAVRATAQLVNGDTGVLLGSVMAHELGHLLLGAGHTPDGVMKAAWGQDQVFALYKQWLNFSAGCAGRIRLALDERQRKE